MLALPALRVRGPYFGLTTLVAVLMLQNFVVVAAGLTGGEIGLTVPDVISIDDKVTARAFTSAGRFRRLEPAVLQSPALRSP